VYFVANDRLNITFQLVNWKLN